MLLRVDLQQSIGFGFGLGADEHRLTFAFRFRDRRLRQHFLFLQFVFGLLGFLLRRHLLLHLRFERLRQVAGAQVHLVQRESHLADFDRETPLNRTLQLIAFG